MALDPKAIADEVVKAIPPDARDIELHMKTKHLWYDVRTKELRYMTPVEALSESLLVAGPSWKHVPDTPLTRTLYED